MSLGMTPQASHTNLRGQFLCQFYQNICILSPALDPTVHGVSVDKISLSKAAVTQGGLGVITAGVFLAGEMAGSGVLALPYAMTGTGGERIIIFHQKFMLINPGFVGLLLVLVFTINSWFSGTRLGLCWIMLEERYEEFRGQVRDPYPAIGEKAAGKLGRIISVVCITLTLYGGGCVFIVLISQLLQSLFVAAGFELSLCVWMVIVAGGLTPLTWMGTPKDFWPIAVGALITTMIACILIVVTCIMDGTELPEKKFPSPSADGFFKG